jgi:diadenosine tetraphosphatase ApaH/serine/threonine PP2A family protein phosphatase
MASPHDLPYQLQAKLRDKGILAYAKLIKFFASLYNAVYVEDRYLMVHGGLPPSIHSLQDLAMADQVYPEKSLLEEILWSDPDDIVTGFSSSYR